MTAGSMARWLFETTGTLSHRTARAGLWLAIGDGCARAAGALKIIILARLLSPADFGIMGVALLVMNWVLYFSELGLSAALIQKRDDIRPYLDTAWTIQLIRSAALTGIVIVSAPLVGWAFNEPTAVPVVRVLAFQILLHGLSNPAVVYLRKDLNTQREVAWRATGIVAGLAVGIPAAFIFRNVWALVLSLLAASVVNLAMSYWVRPYRPSLAIDWQKARELIRFGRWIFSFRAVAFITGNLDGVLVGKVLGAPALGFYQMARQLAVAPTSHLGMHIHGVLFPALSKVSDDRTRRAAVLHTLTVVSSVVVPVGVFITVFGRFIVRLVLGPAWAGMEPLVGILAAVGSMNAILAVTSSFLFAIGRPDLHFRSTLPKLAILGVLLYPAAAMYGLSGVGVVILAAVTASTLYHLVLLLRPLSVSIGDLAGTFRGGVVGSIPFAAAWLVLTLFSVSVPLVAAVSVAASVIVLAYGLRDLLSRQWRIAPAAEPRVTGAA